MFSVFATQSPEITNLNSTEFRSHLKTAKKARLIDVSTREEHNQLHIPGSVNYNVSSPNFTNYIQNLDRSKTYFVYGWDGERGETACNIMKELGFKRVYNLLSGIKSWKGTLERCF